VVSAVLPGPTPPMLGSELLMQVSVRTLHIKNRRNMGLLLQGETQPH
jgi:hypothetical protein